jgi:hypothetical protein
MFALGIPDGSWKRSIVPNVRVVVARIPSSASGAACRLMKAVAALAPLGGAAIAAKDAVPSEDASETPVMSSMAVVVAPGVETDAAHGSPSVCCGTASPDVSGHGLVETDVGAVALTVDAVPPVPFATVSVVPVPGATANEPFVGVSTGTEP